MCRIDNHVVINTEEVGGKVSGALVHLLAVISHLLPDDLAHILNHHIAGGNELHGVQAPVMDWALGETQLLFPGLQLVKLEDICIGHGLAFVLLNVQRQTPRVSAVVARRHQRGAMGHGRFYCAVAVREMCGLFGARDPVEAFGARTSTFVRSIGVVGNRRTRGVER